jgi:hypothetical protein
MKSGFVPVGQSIAIPKAPGPIVAMLVVPIAGNLPVMIIKPRMILPALVIAILVAVVLIAIVPVALILIATILITLVLTAIILILSQIPRLECACSKSENKQCAACQQFTYVHENPPIHWNASSKVLMDNACSARSAFEEGG